MTLTTFLNLEWSFRRCLNSCRFEFVDVVADVIVAFDVVADVALVTVVAVDVVVVAVVVVVVADAIRAFTFCLGPTVKKVLSF